MNVFSNRQTAINSVLALVLMFNKSKIFFLSKLTHTKKYPSKILCNILRLLKVQSHNKFSKFFFLNKKC